MRYERKYRIEDASWREVEAAVLRVPLSFQTSYPDRTVNSIYLDSSDLEALQDNLSGIANRIKYRIRWYGKDLKNVKKPSLEKKIRLNQLGTKEHFAMPDFHIEKGFDLTDFILKNSSVGMALQPVVLVQYVRSYYESFDKKVRATIDRELTYFHFQGSLFFENKKVEDEAIVLEIKYAAELDGQLDGVFQNLPFRLGKNSKFVAGMFGHYY